MVLIILKLSYPINIKEDEKLQYPNDATQEIRNQIDFLNANLVTLNIFSNLT